MENYNNQFVGEAVETTNKLNELAGKASEMIGRRLTENELLEMRGFGDHFLVRELEKKGFKFYNRVSFEVKNMPSGFNHSLEEVNSLLLELKEIKHKLNFNTIVEGGQLIICPNDYVRMNAKF